MSPSDKRLTGKEAETGPVQKRRISWDEFERLTGRPRPSKQIDPAVAFATLLERIRHKPTQAAFGRVIRRRLAAKGMTQAQMAVLVGCKNRGQFGNLLDARSSVWNPTRLEKLLAALESEAAPLLAELDSDDNA